MNKPKNIKDMYDQVCFTNETFNNKPLNPNDEIFWQRLSAQAKLIKEELDELLLAIEQKDFKEVRDAVADVNVTNFGLAYLANIPCKEDMQKVFDSNLSKVSKTIEDARFTQDFYWKEKGVPTYVEECKTMPGFIVKVLDTVVGKDNKEYVKGKFLKCQKSFFNPVFDPIKNYSDNHKPQ